MTFAELCLYAAKRGFRLQQIALRRIVLAYPGGNPCRTYRLMPITGGYAWLSEFEPR